MSKIVNRTNEFYPNLEGAEYLQYQDPSLPKELNIVKNNVAMTGSGKLIVRGSDHPFAPRWGWRYKGSFHVDFNTPEEAIAHFKKIYKLN